MADPPFANDDPIWREALDWLLRTRQASEEPRCKADLNAWLAASAENRRAFEEVNTVWELTGRTEPAFQEKWQPKLPNAKARIADPPQSTAKPTFPARKAFFGVAGATLAAVLAWLFLPALWQHMRADYFTAVGERRIVKLADGSTVHLNTQSALRVKITDRERRVDLLDGEAFFEVTPDAVQPFVVEAGAIAVRVLGTKFNVKLDTASATVAVASGSVLVGRDGSRSTEQLAGGQSIQVSLKGGRFQRGVVSADKVASWQYGQLIVDNRTIGEAIAEIRRYHRGFILVDDELADKAISGVYNLNATVDAVKAVVQPHHGKVRSFTPFMLVVTAG